MPQLILNLGTPNNGDGDPLRTAGGKINWNFTELYTLVSGNVTQLAELSTEGGIKRSGGVITTYTLSGFGEAFAGVSNAAAGRTMLELGTAAQANTTDFAPASHNHTAASITDFAEAVDDRVAGLLVAGSNITLTYDDPANTLTIAANIPAGYTDEQAQDAVGGILVDSPSIDFTYNDAANTITAVTKFGTTAGTVCEGNDPRLSDSRNPTTHSHLASEITDFAEAVDDRVAGLLVAGSNITLSYNDAANTLTISSTGGGGGGGGSYTDEDARDAIGAALTNTSSIQFIYDDPNDQIRANAIFGTTPGTVCEGNDARLSNERVPTDSSVTDAKVAPGAGIAWSKINKSGAVASDVGAAAASHTHAIADVTNLTSQLASKQDASTELNGLSWLSSNGTVERLGPGSYTAYTVTSTAKTLLDDTTTAQMLATLGAASSSTFIATQHSLQGGGDLSSTRILSLVGDTANPGANKVYGTDGSGIRGWYGRTSRAEFNGTAFTVPASATYVANINTAYLGTRIVTLPTGVSIGHQVIVADETGIVAWWQPIRIVAPSGSTVNGSASIELHFPYQSATFTYNGANWFGSLSAVPDYWIYLKNNFFCRIGGPLNSSGTLVATGDFELVTEYAGTGYAINARHLDSYLGGFLFNAGATNVTTDRAYLVGGDNIIFPTGSRLIRLMISVRILRLNDAVDSFNFSFGFRDNVSTAGATTPTDGVYLCYGDSNNPVAGNWTMVTASNNNRTRVDSGVAVTTDQVLLGIEINSSGARFFINDSYVGIIITNIPRTLGRECPIRIGFNRAVGSTALSSIAFVSEMKYLVI